MMQNLVEAISELQKLDKLNEQILTEGTHYDKKAVDMLVNSGLYDLRTSQAIVKDIMKGVNVGILNRSHMEKCILGIVRMIIDEADGSKEKAYDFQDHCYSTFQDYLSSYSEQIKKATPEEREPFYTKFNQQMSFEDVEKELEEMKTELDKKSQEELSKMKFNDTSDYELIPIDSYEQLHSMFGGNKTGDQTGNGSEWCHTNGEHTYSSWTDNKNMFFIIANKDWKDIHFNEQSNKENPKDEYGNSLIAILVNVSKGTLLKATLRCNHVGTIDADNQYKTYAELSEVAGFNVKEAVEKYLSDNNLLRQINKLSKDDLDIQDITLLSIEEAERIPKNIRTYGGLCWWWLRSPGGKQNFAASVFDDGTVYYFGIRVNIDGGCVRPALIISNLKSFNLPLYSKVEIFGRDWIVISDDMVLYDDEAIFYRFDSKSNDYDKSEIKEYIHELLRYEFKNE